MYAILGYRTTDCGRMSWAYRLCRVTSQRESSPLPLAKENSAGEQHLWKAGFLFRPPDHCKYVARGLAQIIQIQLKAWLQAFLMLFELRLQLVYLRHALHGVCSQPVGARHYTPMLPAPYNPHPKSRPSNRKMSRTRIFFGATDSNSQSMSTSEPLPSLILMYIDLYTYTRICSWTFAQI